MEADLAGGEYQTAWNGADENGRALASGVYLCCLEATGRAEVVKMILLR